MKIPSHEIQAFISLAKWGNFTKAAKDLGLSQPAFSSRIKNLESFLEQTLVIREKKGIRLTVEGEKLLQYAKVQRQMEDEFLSQELNGQIRIGGFSSIMRSLVMPALAPLMKKNPKVSVELFTKELSDLFPLLRQGQVDFILTNKDPKREGFFSKHLGIEENVLVAHRDFLDHPIYLDHDPDDVTTSSYFALLGQTPPKNKRYLDDVYGLRDGVKLGLGRAILPRHLIKGENNLIVQRPRTVLKVNVFLVGHDSLYQSKLHQETIAAIEKIKF